MDRHMARQTPNKVIHKHMRHRIVLPKGEAKGKHDVSSYLAPKRGVILLIVQNQIAFF